MKEIDLSTIISIILIIFGLLQFLWGSMFYGTILIAVGVGLHKCIIKKNS